MNTEKMHAALSALAAAAAAENVDVTALAVETVESDKDTEAAAAMLSGAASILRDRLTHHAPILAAVICTRPRGAQAEIARTVAEVTGDKANTVTKRLSRIVAVGRLIIAHPNADVLDLYTFANRADKSALAEAEEARGIGFLSEKPKGTGSKKTDKGPKAVATLVEAGSGTLKGLTDAVMERGTRAEAETYRKVLAANLARIEKALAGGVAFADEREAEAEAEPMAEAS